MSRAGQHPCVKGNSRESFPSWSPLPVNAMMLMVPEAASEVGMRGGPLVQATQRPAASRPLGVPDVRSKT
jgi:hypothetical protein